ncbi:zinc ribbon domain-containing protein, partial [Streptomyces sp. NPDC056689]
MVATALYVDPAYTSQTCADCDHVDKKNRVDQATFICR